MKKVVFSVFLALSVLSCSLPILRSGQAELEVSLGGVLPNISIEDIQYAEANRAITPNSLMVRAVITGEGYSRTFKAPVLAATTLIAGLPAFKELTITLEALDFEGTVTTSWSGKATLNPGRNSVKATMKPVGTIPTFTIGAYPVAIPFGKAQFYRYNPDTNGETFIYINTNSPERLWLGVYNENWEPLDTIAESRGDGWAVINRDTTPVLYVAIANMRNTGYPPKEQSYTLSYKSAHFVSTTGNQDNPGTSARPWNFAGLANQLADNSDDAFLIAAGAYDTVEGLTLYGATWIFGGFDPSDWKKRSPRSTTLESNSSNPALSINNESGMVVLDGLTIQTNYSSGSPLALYYDGYSILSIINCAISGTRTSEITTSLHSSAIATSYSSSGTMHILGSSINGGNIEATGNMTLETRGIYITSYANLELLFCNIDGGTIKNTTATNSIERQFTTTAITIANPENSPSVITSSRIWGGTIYSNRIFPATCALSLESYGEVTIASSILNAGYINYTGTSGSVWMAGFANRTYGDTNYLIAGSIIDSGCLDTSGNIATTTCIEQQTSTGTIAGSIFSTNNQSSGEIITTPLYLFDGVSQPTLYDCAFIGPVKDAYIYNSYSGTGSFMVPEGTALLFPNAAQDTLFASYVKPVSSSAFFANSWRPAGLLTSTKTTTLPSDWGINMDTLGMYPFLIVDLVNQLRPMNAGWTIGPYQN